MKKKPTLKKRKSQHNFIIYSQLAFQMLVIIAGGVFIGFKLDQFYPNSYSIFTLSFSIIFIAISIYYTINHQYLCDRFTINIPLKSIYLFNYFAVTVFLIISKANLIYKVINILTFFILLTLIKMLVTLVFFLYLDNYLDYEITLIV